MITRRALRSFALLSTVAIIWSGIAAATRSPRRTADDILGEVIALVQHRSLEPVSNDSVSVAAARGVLEHLRDPYASLMSPADLERFEKETIGNRYGGLGLVLEDLGTEVLVGRVFVGGPAYKAAIRSGDRILEVDGVDVRRQSMADISKRITGVPGTSVALVIARAAGTLDTLTVVRAAVHQPAVPFVAIVPPSVGYVPLQLFSESSGAEVADAMRMLRERGAKSIVLDLRGNGGGELNAAVATTQSFAAAGTPVVSIHERGVPPRTLRTTGAGDVSTPVVVLIDERTASASEIVAGALQDADRALVVGSPSYGKGVLQGAFRLSGGWAAKLTTGQWFTPTGRSINRARRLDDVGRLVTVQTDSALDSTRPVVTTSAGRRLLGGGGIVPDVRVVPDTLSTSERELGSAIAAAPGALQAIRRLAFVLRDSVDTLSIGAPRVRDRVYRELTSTNARISRDLFDRGYSLIDRSLTQSTLELSRGDSAAFLRRVRDDRQLRVAVELLSKAQSTAQLLAEAPGHG